MRKFILTLLALSCFAGIVNAQKLGDKIRVGNDVYMLVNEIKGVQQNEVFQQNVDIMRRYAEALAKAKENLTKEGLSLIDKEALKNKIQEIEDLYFANNAVMKKQYGFVIDRQYRQDYDDIYVSTLLSDSELDNLKLEDGSDIDLDKIVLNDSKKIYRHLRIEGSQDVMKFQRALISFVSRQVELNTLKENLIEELDPMEQSLISNKISTLNKALEESEAVLLKDYKINPNNRAYFLEINSTKLYLLLTAQELATMGN